MSQIDAATEALAELDALEASGRSAFEAAKSADAVEAARVEFLGMKQGRIKTAQERLKSLEPSAKRAYGQRFNAVKGALEAAHEAAKARVERPGSRRDPASTSRCPGLRPKLGHRHPLTQTADELIDIFGRFGFAVARGPEVEDVRHNFDALNIPPVHPARDPLDNFYLPDGTMLRSQTSTVQIRVMENQPPPVRVIAIGRVYRPDTVDATHSFMFHQVEGLDGRPRRDDGRPEDRPAAVREELPGRGRQDPVPPELLPVHRAERRGRHALARRRPLG